MIAPSPLPFGGKIGICAVAGPVNEERMAKATRNLSAQGYEVELSPSALKRNGLFSASDEIRKRELEEMFSRKDIQAVFCTRGGVGCSRLLEILDSEVIAKSRKPFLGFSDVTALQWWLWARQKFISYSGPLAVEWDGAVSERSRKQALDRLAGKASPDLLADFSRDSLRVLRGKGTIRGPILAGNLCMITTLIGTPYLPDLTGAILLIEDVNEPPHRVDRMLFHLRNAGVLSWISALLVGDLADENGKEAQEFLQTSLLDSARGTTYPILTGFPYGHGAERMTIPVGAAVELDVENLSLALIESGLIGAAQ